MFYKLVFDMDRIDESIKNGTNTIYAETTNVDSIVYENVKRGFFDNIIFSERNITNWPIVHIKVMKKFSEMGIMGIQYLPIKLVDVVTRKVNENYVLMYIQNFIEAFDMNKSKYKYNEKYNFYTFMPNATYMNSIICSQYDIFRCTHSVSAIYISEKVKELIKNSGWIGFDFVRQLEV